MEELIRKKAEKAIKDNVFPGCVVGVIKNNKRMIYPYGHFTYDDTSSLVQSKTIYDVASVTKMVATSSSILYLIDQGKLKLDDKVFKYINGFNNHTGKEDVTIKHLLTYTLDIDVPSTTSLKDKTAEEIIKIMVEAPLKSAPGKEVIYTNSTAILMGLIVKEVTGKQLDQFANEIFYNPLGMKMTTFYPEKFSKSSIAPTEVDEWRKRVIQGEVHDEGTYTLKEEGYYLGAAGLFSTADDLLIFLSMLLNQGDYQGKKFFSESMIKSIHTNQLPGGDKEMGLGWDLNNKSKMGDLSSNQVFGHSGFTGTMVLCDPIKKVGIVTLSNRTYPKRSDNIEKMNKFRHDIADIVFSSL